MFHSLITINKEAYQVKFGIQSLIALDKISYIKDRAEVLKKQFCISEITNLDGSSLTFQEKEQFFDKYINDSESAELINNSLQEAIHKSLGDYKEMDWTKYSELLSIGVGEIGLSLQDFNAMAPAEIDLAYKGYLRKKELEANCNLIAARKNRDKKASLISLLGGDGYNYISEAERKDTLQSLDI